MTPDLSFDPDSPAVDVLRRAGAWSVSSWRHGHRAADARAALAALAELATAHDGRPRPDVPPVGVHALADQLVVLAGDAFHAGAPAMEIEAVFATLRVRLGLSAH